MEGLNEVRSINRKLKGKLGTNIKICILREPKLHMIFAVKCPQEWQKMAVAAELTFFINLLSP